MGWTSGFPEVMETSSADAFEMTCGCCIWNFKTVASFCSWAGWFESCLVAYIWSQVFWWSYFVLIWLNFVYSTKDGEIQEERKEFENFKRTLQRKLTEVEEEMDTQKRELTTGEYCFFLQKILCKTLLTPIYLRKHLFTNNVSHLVTKPTKWLRPAKTQISLGIRPVWSESLLCVQWVAKDPGFLHVDSEDSDQTGRMPRLIWVFAVRTLSLLVLSWSGSFLLSLLHLVVWQTSNW